MSASPTTTGRPNDLRFLALTALALAIFPFAFHLIGGYAGLATQILIMGIAAIGFNLLLGYAGILSYGHAAFYGVGGYLGALTLMKFFHGYQNLELAIVIGVLGAAVAAFLIGTLVVRLYGIYFALLTVAFAEMLFFIVFQWRSLTNGDDGLQGIPSPKLFGALDLTSPLAALSLGPLGDLSDLRWWYVFVAVLLLLVLFFVRRLVASQFGEVLGAIRENEERSTFVGYRPRAYKLAAFVISGALAGLSGALRAIYDGSISTSALSIETSGNFVIYTVIGGVKTLFGPLIGTAAIMYLQNVLSAKTDAWRLIEGLLFVLVIVFLPGGIMGSVRERLPIGKWIATRRETSR